VVSRLRYPPQGHRSVAGAMPVFDFERVNGAEATAAVNRTLLITVMIETPLAVENADAIAAVEGVDTLLIGTNDLSTEMGIPGRFGDPRMIAAYEAVTAACRRHGKWAGMGGATAEEDLRRYIGMGVRMVLAGGDLALMLQAGSRMTKLVRGCL
jgi:2-keto-3-deoxy-L-rhamnonate aldolase RhmA